MAAIIGVHGIGHRKISPSSLSEDWCGNLAGGIAAFRSGCILPREAFSMVYYADLYLGKGTRASIRDYDLHDLDTEWEQDFAIALGQAAAVILNTGASVRRMIKIPRDVQRALTLFLQVPGLGWMTENLVVRLIKEAHRYIHDSEIREAAVKRVHDAIDATDTRVVLAHSLGTVVAYEALCRNSYNVDTFITVGSPLGLRNSIFSRLQPPPDRERGVWPGSIRRWVNIAQPGDVVAICKQLCPLFHRGPHGKGIEDSLAIDPQRFFEAHNSTHYLTSPQVAEAVIRGTQLFDS